MFHRFPHAKTAHSIKHALSLASHDPIWICGGEKLYEEAFPLADRLYLTQIESLLMAMFISRNGSKLFKASSLQANNKQGWQQVGIFNFGERAAKFKFFPESLPHQVDSLLSNNSMNDLKFFTFENLEQIRTEFGTPSYVYDEMTLRQKAQELKAFPNAFGLFPRYAMKAAPTAAILRIFNEEGLGIDASSIFEVERAIRAGFGTESIS